MALSNIEKIIFVKHLSLMLRSGISLLESLAALKKESKGKSYKILQDVYKRIENGESFSSALSIYKKYFGDFFISIIKISEASGTLEENLFYLAGQMEKDYRLRQRIRSAMYYPLIVLLLTVFLIIGLIVFVLPRILPLFTGLGVSLPLATRALIWITAFVGNYFIWGVLAIISLFVIYRILILRIKPMQYFVDKLFLKIPIVGRIILFINLIFASRTLSLLIRSGIPIVQALEITAASTANLAYKDLFNKASLHIQAGKKLSSFFVDKENFFPPTYIKLIETAEKTGHLETILLYLAKFYEHEMTLNLRYLSRSIEPILLIAMGLGVGFVAVAILSAIYSVGSAIRR